MGLIYPGIYILVDREGTNWHFRVGTIFYNPSSVPFNMDIHDRLKRHGLTMGDVATELFRLNGGKPGHYLANIRDKKYYYCGTEEEDIRSVLLMLGVGRAEPQYSENDEDELDNESNS